MFTPALSRNAVLDRANRLGLLWLLATIVGCSALDHSGRDAMKAARRTVVESPELALSHVERVLERYPDHVPAKRLAATALENLGRLEDSSREWARVLANDDSGRKDLWIAHLGQLRTLGTLIGEIPNEIEIDSKQAPTLGTALESCEALLTRKPENRELRVKRGELLYRLGRQEESAAQLDDVLKDFPSDPLVTYLRTLVTEHQKGLDDVTIRQFCELANADDDRVRGLASKHLIFLIEVANIDGVTRDNVRGSLIRMARSENCGPEIRAWVKDNESATAANMSDRQVARQIRDVVAARELGHWAHAWNILKSLPEADSTVAEERILVATGWGNSVVEKGGDLLSQGNLAGARGSVDELAAIAGVPVADDLRQRIQSFSNDVAQAEARSRIARELRQVEEALRLQDAETALGMLDAIDELGGQTGVLERQIREMRAEAWYLANEPMEALTILDRLRPVTTPRLQRIHGILLARAGRSDEALVVLDGLPLGHLVGTALEAYFHALEQQKDWDAILARMLTLGPVVPDEYRTIRRLACFEAAQIRLRRRNPEAALELLNAHLDGNELGLPPVHEVYLQCLLKTGQIEQIYELIQLQGVDRLAPVSFGLASDIATQVAPLFSDADAFRLLRTLDANTPGSATEQLMPLWSRFGSYLPRPGDYRVSYRVTDMNSQGRVVETRSVEQQLRSTNGGFDVTEQNLPGSVRWEVRDNLWIRKTSRGEERIPVRVSGPPPYEPINYKLGDADWTAEVIETNGRVTIDNKTYAGCLRVRLTNSTTPQEVTLLTLAPDLGEIRREVQQLGVTSYVRELVRVTDTSPQENP